MLDLLDRRSVVSGGLACLLVAGPAAILLAVADRSNEGDESNWVLAVLVLIVAGFLLGGATAARRAPRAPFVNGAAAALSVFALVQGVAIVVNLIDGDGINGLALVFNALLAASIGTVGGWLGIRGTNGHTEAGGGEPAG